MAGAASNVTITLPSGTISEPTAIQIAGGDKYIGVTQSYNPNLATVTITSFDDPEATIGTRGNFSLSGTNVDTISHRGVVERVDTSVTLNGLVTYTTTVRLIAEGSSLVAE